MNGRRITCVHTCLLTKSHTHRFFFPMPEKVKGFLCLPDWVLMIGVLRLRHKIVSFSLSEEGVKINQMTINH